MVDPGSRIVQIQLVADLVALSELCVWMRSVGATSARVGDVSLTLGDPPIAQLVYDDGEAPSPLLAEDTELRDLETLLHSSGADPTPFLRKGRP